MEALRFDSGEPPLLTEIGFDIKKSVQNLYSKREVPLLFYAIFRPFDLRLSLQEGFDHSQQLG
jgi:hypothetical protein